MLPAQFLAVIAAHVFPLHAEIDCGPLALRAGTGYKFRVVVESATGKKADGEVGIGAAATPADVAEVVSFCLSGTVKANVRRQGVVVTVTEFGGSPVRRVTFEFNDAGPRPAVRWVPKSK